MSFKLLTPVDVKTETFTTRRFREGYDTYTRTSSPWKRTLPEVG